MIVRPYPIHCGQCRSSSALKDVSKAMKTGKPREAAGVNAEPRMRIKSAHPHRFHAGGN
jgi:hypothetical protein